MKMILQTKTYLTKTLNKILMKRTSNKTWKKNSCMRRIYDMKKNYFLVLNSIYRMMRVYRILQRSNFLLYRMNYKFSWDLKNYSKICRFFSVLYQTYRMICKSFWVSNKTYRFFLRAQQRSSARNQNKIERRRYKIYWKGMVSPFSFSPFSMKRRIWILNRSFCILWKNFQSGKKIWKWNTFSTPLIWTQNRSIYRFSIL